MLSVIGNRVAGMGGAVMDGVGTATSAMSDAVTSTFSSGSSSGSNSPAPPPTSFAPAKPEYAGELKEIPTRQGMMDILIGRILPKDQLADDEKADSGGNNPRFALYRFCANHLSVKNDGDEWLCTAPDIIIKKVVKYLLSDIYVDSVNRSDAEKTVLILLQRYVGLDTGSVAFPKLNPDFEDMVGMFTSKATKLHFTRVRLYLNKLQQKYEQVVEIFVREAARPGNEEAVEQLFEYMTEVMQGPAADPRKPQVKETIWQNCLLKRCRQLVQMDSTRTVKMVLKFFPRRFEQVKQALSENRELLFKYLKCIVANTKKDDKATRSFSRAFRGQDAPERDEEIEKLLAKRGVDLGEDIYETYIRLLCDFSKDEVLQYLMEHSAKINIQKILEYCRKNRIHDATAFLMERTGDVMGALRMMLEGFNDKFYLLWDFFDKELKESQERKGEQTIAVEDVFGDSAEVKAVRKKMDGAIALCQRHSERYLFSAREKGVIDDGRKARQRRDGKRIDQLKKELATLRMEKTEAEAVSEKMWFALLKNFFDVQAGIKHSDSDDAPIRRASSGESGDKLYKPDRKFRMDVHKMMKTEMNERIRSALRVMMGEIEVSKILTTLLMEQENEQFGYLRETILGMLFTYKYERTMISSVNQLLRSGLICQMTTQRACYSSAMRPGGLACSLCDKPVSENSDKADPSDRFSKTKLFACGHIFHDPCVGWDAKSCPVCGPQAGRRKTRRNPRSGGMVVRAVEAPKRQPQSETEDTDPSQENVEAEEKAQLAVAANYAKKLEMLDRALERKKRSYKRGKMDLNLKPASAYEDVEKTGLNNYGYPPAEPESRGDVSSDGMDSDSDD